MLWEIYIVFYTRGTHEGDACGEFSDVTFASDDDNDISDLNEFHQEVEKTPIEDYGQDVIFKLWFRGSVGVDWGYLTKFCHKFSSKI